jgi:myo-inositol-1(or 4)-monophosphatase
VLATILDPLRDELFVAEKGQGATLNNQPIAVTTVQTLTQVLIVTGFPYNRKTNSHNNLAEFNRIMPTVQGVRRSGSAALDLAYVACGRFDAYWELLVSPWDWMAGALLVQEAGGKITDAAGQILTLDSYSIIAANQELHPQLITLVSDQPPAKNPT